MSSQFRPKYLPGTTYKTRGRQPRLCTVIDVHITYSLAGDLVRVRYVSIHEFMGQTITNNDVVQTTIDMGLVSGVGPLDNDAA